jgi:hypothetical protein
LLLRCGVAQKAKKPIFAFGFDAAGFSIPSGDLKLLDGLRLRYVSYRADDSLADAEGVIIPSGIFESAYGGRDWLTGDKDQIALREKQLFQLFERGGWVAFLLGKVDNGPSGEWSDTDLAKGLLNPLFKAVIAHEPNPHTTCKADEFRPYLDKYGISRTTLRWPKNEDAIKVIAEANQGVASAAMYGRMFFLPIPELKGDFKKLGTAVTLCAVAVNAYRERNEIHIPAWVDELKFKTEKALENESSAIQRRILEIEEERATFRKYKAVLSASGDQLREQVIGVLSGYFGLDVTTEDKNVEDAIIRESGQPAFVVEVKGVRGGLKRDHVNQVDSHRERLGYSADVSGLLILNDFMELDGLEEREAKSFDNLHLKHATNFNVRILRTTTLFRIMLEVERMDSEQRAAELMRLCRDATPLVLDATVEGNRTGK